MTTDITTLETVAAYDVYLRLARVSDCLAQREDLPPNVRAKYATLHEALLEAPVVALVVAFAEDARQVDDPLAEVTADKFFSSVTSVTTTVRTTCRVCGALSYFCVGDEQAGALAGLAHFRDEHPADLAVIIAEITALRFASRKRRDDG